MLGSAPRSPWGD